ncbi:MAG: hypothetical protein AB7F35_01130 [Acetobacteraceae bacterium]
MSKPATQSLPFKAEVRKYDPDDCEFASFATEQEALEWMSSMQPYGFGRGWINNREVDVYTRRHK